MTTKAASFADFLNAPSRLREAKPQSAKSKKTELRDQKQNPAYRKAKKEKVGLTLDPSLIEAIDDYIYAERKKGNKLKKNDVYEAALRQYLGIK